MSSLVQNVTHSDPGLVAVHDRKKLMTAFWVGIWILLGFAILTTQSTSAESILAACLIAIAVIIPVYLWCSGRVMGIPLFPVFAVPYLWTYALPMVTDHPAAITYSSDQHLFAGVTVASFLSLATAVWYKVSTIPIRPPVSYRALKSTSSASFFLYALAAYSLVVMGFVGGWFGFMGAWVAVLRSIAFGLGSLSIFLLAYLFGKNDLSPKSSFAFLALLCILIVSSAASLLLVDSLSILFLSALGFVLGRRRMPWLALLLVLMFLSTLHHGKAVMRQMYMYGDEYRTVQPWEYVGWFTEWTEYSLNSILSSDSSTSVLQNSLVGRTASVHLLLMIQELSPHTVPYLSGATYTIIPNLLIPRFINPDRVGTHEGTSLLNIHYEKQTREDTYRTTIGWGLLNEAYANFGFGGSLTFAIILGVFYGGVTRWTLNVPVLSARSLFGILLMNFAYQTESSAGVYVTALFQSTLPLILVVFLFMKDQVNPEYTVVERQPLGTAPLL
jgi:hypothetical protein